MIQDVLGSGQNTPERTLFSLFRVERQTLSYHLKGFPSDALHVLNPSTLNQHAKVFKISDTELLIESPYGFYTNTADGKQFKYLRSHLCREFIIEFAASSFQHLNGFVLYRLPDAGCRPKFFYRFLIITQCARFGIFRSQFIGEFLNYISCPFINSRAKCVFTSNL